MSRPSRSLLGTAGVCLAMGIALPATAFEIDTGVDGLAVRFDNTLKYNLGYRVDGRDSRIANNATSDEGDFKFDRGDVVTNRIDLLSELEMDWQNRIGARVSAAAWYDDAYEDVTVKKNPAFGSTSYDGDSYSSYTKRFYRGPSGEFLDAFVYGNFSLADRPINVKAGKHVVYWGVSLFTQNGIANNQHPIDAKKSAATPGTEVRETFLPLNQVSMQSQLTNNVSLAAQYYLDWDHIRIPEGGTFLGGTDFLFSGPDALGPMRRQDPLEPDKKRGNWGVNLKWTAPELNATTFGLYYREFDEKNNFWVQTAPANGLYRAVFAENVKLYGISVDTTLNKFAVGAELVTRRDTSLNSTAVSAANLEGARGNTYHALVNTIFSLPSTALWDTGTLVGELTYDYLDKVTKNENLYKDADNCTYGKKEGCATRDAWGFNLSFTPQYLGVWPGIDLSLPMTLGGGLHGNSAMGGVNEGAYSYSIGIQADIRKQYLATLAWADSTADIKRTAAGTYVGNGGWQTTDRGRITLTLKTSF
ncbi:DUF1302 domain-containing protein [Stutzerimonas stutzeri]|uniref:DUF1302 domain-containing protein n=1 Tax=Stutzerimonas stutzeri TaxID=316 RepID=UPI0031330927